MIMHNPVHPGLILKEWLHDITLTEAARRLGITRAALSRIINTHVAISPDMALRLATSLDTDPEYWLKLQNQYDLYQLHQRPRPIVLKMHDPSSDA
jgi:addiction module HigA family antidote